MEINEAYKILRCHVGNFLDRNQLTYITAESRWRNVWLSLLFPSLLLSIAQLIQEMHEMSLLLHSLEERLENKTDS